MALDGIVIADIVSELKSKLIGGRIMKISQPEKDEIVLTIKNYDQYKLMISSSAGLPLIYITENTKPAPLTAPNFCMLLRKHLNSARILDITQPSLERIIDIKIEHLDELGDLKIKHLIVEIMGKHSNIIFADDNLKIVDSIKHVSGLVSSQREVLPGRGYFIVETVKKLDPLTVTEEDFAEQVTAQPSTVCKALVTALTGISPLTANEIAYRAGIDGDAPVASLGRDVITHLYRNFARVMDDVKAGTFARCIVYKGDAPAEFSSIALTGMRSEEMKSETMETPSRMLETFYAQKEAVSRIRQKSSDLRKVVSNAVTRVSRKYDIQSKELESTNKRDRYKEYGDLLMTYGYSVKPGEKTFSCESFYTGEQVTIQLDDTLSAAQNAKHYYERYAKLKRTFDATSKLILETKAEMEHLDSIMTALDIAVCEDDLAELKEELIEYGYMRRHNPGDNKGKGKKTKIKSKPFHYVSSDGFDIYVGKNNYQNDELTFKFAKGNDLWFHAKGVPGSHVVVVNDGREFPDRLYEEAGAVAAFYSKNREAEKVEIDYIEKKNVKKPAGSKPGFVVYYTNYSLMARPTLEGLEEK